MPKYWLKSWLYWVGKGPEPRNENTDITVRIIKKIKRIVWRVAGLSLR
jgi:hypothetical protein